MHFAKLLFLRIICIFCQGWNMQILSQAFLLTGIAIGISYLNHKTFKIQATVAVLLSSLICSIALILYHEFMPEHVSNSLIINISHIDFSEILMHGILGFLLFAGTLTIDSEKLSQFKKEIAVLAFGSTIISMLLIGIAIYYINSYFGIIDSLALSACLLFGALISPTDPIAVLNTLKQAKAPKAIETILAGESLFNDGIGIVSFLTIYSVLFLNSEPTTLNVIKLFCQQSIGGLFIGASFGFIANKAIRHCDDTETFPELITIAIPTAGYSICEILNISGPLAMVAAGIYMTYNCPKKIFNKLHLFWLIIDELLNIVLFLLVGLEIVLVNWNFSIATLALVSIVVTLAVRTLTILAPMLVFKVKKTYNEKTAAILIWGGLRGGLALALVLSLPDHYMYKSTILAMTYAVVLWSIIVQGTTVPLILKKPATKKNQRQKNST